MAVELGADYFCHEYRYGVAYLASHGAEAALECESARERLKACCFPYAYGAILLRVSEPSVGVADAPCG